MTTPQNKYQREIASGVYVDVYDVLVAFGVTNPAIAHAIKKLLCPGQRGHKSLRDDLVEARQSVDRAIELAGVNVSEPEIKLRDSNGDNISKPKTMPRATQKMNGLDDYYNRRSFEEWLRSLAPYSDPLETPNNDQT